MGRPSGPSTLPVSPAAMGSADGTEKAELICALRKVARQTSRNDNVAIEARENMLLTCSLSYARCISLRPALRLVSRAPRLSAFAFFTIALHREMSVWENSWLRGYSIVRNKFLGDGQLG